MADPVPTGWCDPRTVASASLGTTPLTGRTGDGQLIPMSPSALCSLGWRPILITGLLRELLTRYFQGPLNPEEPDLRHLVWREAATSGILIESVYRWRGDLVEKRPAIIVKPNGRQNVRKGIADGAGADERGMREYQTFWVGAHTLFCIHGTGASADVLATAVQRELTQFAPAIAQYMGLFRWQVTEVGAASVVEEARQNFVVPVTVGWAYDEHWKVEQESLKVRKLTLATLLQGAGFD